MTVQTITDAESVARLRKLLPYLESQADQHEAFMRAHVISGNVVDANNAQQLLTLVRGAAIRCRNSIMEAEKIGRPGVTDFDEQGRRLDALVPPAHVHTPACPILDCPFEPAERAAGLADLMQREEPPGTLVGLVNWLRKHFGFWFPNAPAEVWQGIGAVLLSFRRIGGTP